MKKTFSADLHSSSVTNRHRLNKFISALVAPSVLLSLLALSIVACQSDKSPRVSIPSPKYVVLIGLDGLSSASLRDTVCADVMPFLSSLMERGSWAFHKRSVLPSSSACNWASLYMGAGPEQHGYNNWGSRRPDFPSDTLTEHGIFPDIYYQIKLARPEAKIAHFYEWDGIHYVVDTLSVDIERMVKPTEEDVRGIIRTIITEKPLFTSIIMNHPDHEGHTIGWKSAEYYSMIHLLDQGIQFLYEALDRAGMADETLFIITADHGGIGRGHGGTTMDEMETPLVFVGPGIRKGYEIQCTLSICDIIPTVALMLDVERPHAWVGRPITEIFE